MDVSGNKIYEGNNKMKIVGGKMCGITQTICIFITIKHIKNNEGMTKQELVEKIAQEKGIPENGSSRRGRSADGNG